MKNGRRVPSFLATDDCLDPFLTAAPLHTRLTQVTQTPYSPVTSKRLESLNTEHYV